MNAVDPGNLLQAETTVVLASSADVLARLRDHFTEHGSVSGTDDAWQVEFGTGRAAARIEGETIHFRVSATDATSLSYLQWGVAEHLCEFANGKQPEIIWDGGVEAGELLPYFREMRVVGARQITPRMRRITLAGHDLQRFGHGGIHVRLLFAPEPGVLPVWPVMAPDGRQAWPVGPRPLARVYTIRRLDIAAGEIDIDFVLHKGKDMPGASFARDARPGDVVGMTGPGGAGLREADRYIFLGDETGLPAIARMLEELPADRHATAFVEIADEAEKQHLESRAALELTWLSRGGIPAGSKNLLPDALRSLDNLASDGSIFVWAGCEHAAARTMRAHLRDERRFPKQSALVVAYWRCGTAGEVD